MTETRETKIRERAFVEFCLLRGEAQVTVDGKLAFEVEPFARTYFEGGWQAAIRSLSSKKDSQP